MFWRTVFIFVGLALGCGLIGAVFGRWWARRYARQLHIPMRATPAKQRQSVAYLEVVIAWHSYLRTVRTLVYPEEGPPTTQSRDLVSVLRSRAQLQAVGSPVVQDLHDQVLETAVALIDLLRSQTMSPLPDRMDVTSLRIAFTAISDRIGALERQMLHEVGQLPSLPEDEIEMTGRAVPPRGAPARESRVGSPARRAPER